STRNQGSFRSHAAKEKSCGTHEASKNPPRTDWPDRGQSSGNSYLLMKNTLLFSTLVVGLALTGCNKSTRTSTASNEPARSSYPSTTATTTTTTTTPATSTD